MNNRLTTKISVKDNLIGVMRINNKDYISLTDLARYKNPNKEGNIRDYTDILHLVVLSNLKVLNASMIENNISQKDRLEKLNATAKRQINILANDSNVNGITKKY